MLPLLLVLFHVQNVSSLYRCKSDLSFVLLGDGRNCTGRFVSGRVPMIVPVFCAEMQENYLCSTCSIIHKCTLDILYKDDLFRCHGTI